MFWNFVELSPVEEHLQLNRKLQICIVGCLVLVKTGVDYFKNALYILFTKFQQYFHFYSKLFSKTLHNLSPCASSCCGVSKAHGPNWKSPSQPTGPAGHQVLQQMWSDALARIRDAYTISLGVMRSPRASIPSPAMWRTPTANRADRWLRRRLDLCW